MQEYNKSTGSGTARKATTLVKAGLVAIALTGAFLYGQYESRKECQQALLSASALCNEQRDIEGAFVRSYRPLAQGVAEGLQHILRQIPSRQVMGTFLVLPDEEFDAVNVGPHRGEHLLLGKVAMGFASSDNKTVVLRENQLLDGSYATTIPHEIAHVYHKHLDQMMGEGSRKAFETEWKAIAGIRYGTLTPAAPRLDEWKDNDQCPLAIGGQTQRPGARSLGVIVNGVELDDLAAEAHMKKYGPKHGCVSPYSSTSLEEDIACTVGKTLSAIDTMRHLVNPQETNDDRYRKKLDLLRKYGFVAQEAYDRVTQDDAHNVPENRRNSDVNAFELRK